MAPKKATASASGGGDDKTKEKKGGSSSVKVIKYLLVNLTISLSLNLRLDIFYVKNNQNVLKH